MKKIATTKKIMNSNNNTDSNDDNLQPPPLRPMVKQFCLNWENCGYRQYQYLNEEPSLCGQCLYNEEKMKEENKEKETDKVILKRPRSDTVADFNLSAPETGSGFKKKQHK